MVQTSSLDAYNLARTSADGMEVALLTGHPDRFVRIAAFTNCKIPNSVRTPFLQRAVKDENEDSVVSATAFLELVKYGEDMGPFAIDPFLKRQIHRAFRNTNDWYLRSVLAELSGDPDEITSLYETRDWNVWLALAKNPHCPQSILDDFANLKKEPSGKIPDRFDVIRSIAIARGGVVNAPPQTEARSD